MATIISLRAAVHRLNTTPVKELPPIAEYIASAISDCGAILSVPTNNKPSAGSLDRTALIHKLKARITSLLQDKTVEARFTAIILVKALVEAGQWEILRGCEPWVRALLGILGKPDPSASKKLCIITLTRIFQLTHQYQTLVREITTPSLPSFITSCLNLISKKRVLKESRKLKFNGSLIETVLSSFLILIPNHPTIFRPFSSQIHDLLLPLVGSTSTIYPVSESIISLAQRIFISLHQCAPKNSSGEEWLKAFRSTIYSAHRTGDNLFRGLREQWESVDPVLRQSSKSKVYSDTVGDDGPDSLGLPGWVGIEQGSDRLATLLKLLSSFLRSRTHSTVSIPVGSVLDLTSRLASITVPTSDSVDDMSNSFNPEITRNERESLWSALPDIHVATLELLSVVIEMLGVDSIAVGQSCLDQALWLFDSSNFHRSVCSSAYRCIATILSTVGFSQTKSGVSSLTSVARRSCSDLLALTSIDANDGQKSNGKSNSNKNGTNNADMFLKSNSKNNAPDTPSKTELCDNTATPLSLLLSILSYVPTELIPLTLRSEIDRTAILTGNKQLIMASVLNPISPAQGQRGHASIVPFLARSHANDIEVEGLLRPRMPVIMTGAGKSRLDYDVGSVDEEFLEEDDQGQNQGRMAHGTLMPENIPSQSQDQDMQIPDALPSTAPTNSVFQSGLRGSKRRYEGAADHSSHDTPQLDKGQHSILSSDKRPRIESGFAASSALAPSEKEDIKPGYSTPGALSNTTTHVPGEALEITSTFEASQTRLSEPEPIVNREVKIQTRGETVLQLANDSSPPQPSEDDADSDNEVPVLNMESDTDSDEEMGS